MLWSGHKKEIEELKKEIEELKEIIKNHRHDVTTGVVYSLYA